MEKINSKAIWSVLDIKTLIILGLVTYIAISIFFGDKKGENDLLKKENTELHTKNDSIDNVMKQKDELIKNLKKMDKEKEILIDNLAKQHNNNLNEIEKLKKKKNETSTIVDNSTDAEVLKYLSDYVNRK